MLGETLVAAQPAMGSVLTVVDLAQGEVARAQTVRAGARAVQRAMERYVRRQVTAVERAARRLPGVLPGRAVVLTLSSSEVVYRALLAARRRGRLARVVVAESRPGREGEALARRLAARGVPVTVIVDALAPTVVGEVDAVVVGADAVTATAVWHKCGTFGLALAARATRRPLLVVTSTDRLLGGSLAGRLRLPGTEPRHISTGRRKPVHALDRLFEATPLRLVAAVLTDAGTMAPETVRRRLRARKAGRGRPVEAGSRRSAVSFTSPRLDTKRGVRHAASR